VSPRPPPLSHPLHLDLAHLLTPSVRFILQQNKHGVANPKLIVAPRTSSRPHLLLLETIEPVVITIEFLSTS
jgi:hypothetical protein